MESEQTTSKIADIESAALRTEVRTLADRVDQTYMELGRRLRVVCDGGYATDWGFKGFDEYVEAELGFKRRKARYLMMIADKASEFGLDDECLRTLGWTKAKEILSRVETREGFDSWRSRVITDNLSVSELQIALRRELEGVETDAGGTERDADGNKVITTPSGERIHLVEVPLYDPQYENVKLALVRAGEIAGSDKIGHLLDMVCLDWLANNSSVESLGDKLAEWVNRNLIELEDDEA